MERSRRSGTKVKPHSKFAELRRLRQEGKTRLSTYEIKEEEDLYEEVDEDAYKKVVRNRLMQDDFVVGDGGEGYVDNGMDDWGGDGYYSEEEEAEEDDKQLSKKELKRKREEDKERKNKQEGAIHKYFNNKTGAAPAKPKAMTPVVDKGFLDDLLDEFDTKPAPAPPPKKSRREEPARKARKLSPPRKKPNNGLVGKMPTLTSSPPPLGTFEDDDAGFTLAPVDDEDTPMGDDLIPPSTPSAKVPERKLLNPEDGEDEDEFAVAEIKGNKNISTAKVNITSSRPLKTLVLSTPATSSPAKAPTVDSLSWTQVSGGLNIIESSDRSAVGKVAQKDVLEDDGSLKMFWLDYAESNGSLLLFGKVKDKDSGKFVSAMLKVDGIMRNLFFFPRTHRTCNGKDTDEAVGMEDVYEEVATVMERHRFDSFRVKTSKRKYAFELGIPRENEEYLKVLYPYTKPALSMDLSGDTYSCVFGTNTAMFEQFVLCRNIMGPCWLSVRRPVFGKLNNASWCKLEVQVDSPNDVTAVGDADTSEAPTLTLMSVALRTIHNVKDNKQEIIAISARIYENVSLADAAIDVEKMPHQVFTVVRPVQSTVFPAGFEKLKERHPGNIHLETSENMLLSSFLAKLQFADPDVLMGHQLENVDYPVLLHRLKEKKTHNWSRIGRLRRSVWPGGGGGKFTGTFFVERQLAAGRLMCDLANDLGKSLMTKCQSWSLTEMCDLILGKKRQDIDTEEALKSWASSAKGFLDYLVHCEVDTFFIAAVAMKIQMLPLTKQLTNLAGNSWARTLSGTRAERNEYILLHEFYRKKYLCPDKTFQKKNQKDDENPDEESGAGKKKDKFKGGLVFEPEKGLYDKYILVMDFNSLYPSIMQEYNICFTTVERTNLGDDIVPDVPEEQALGVLPRLIATLVQRRRQVKELMKDKKATAVQKTQWDIKQQALKLTANSMYGCLGYTRSRFYARPLAMLTTFKGREILQSTKDLAESMSLQVIYGDTDSVMINTLADNYADAVKIGNDFKRQVNDRYKLLEIDIDNVFQRLLLHAKKKYAAMNCVSINGKLDTKMEVKGLDMRRREYCQLSKEASAHILNEVFTGDEKEVVVERIHDYLRELAENVREGRLPLSKYTIYTRLGKNPEEYPQAKTMPQVQVALRKKARGESVKAGDVISFIITAGAGEDSVSDTSAAERAYATPDVIKPDSGLKPDPEWYLVKQIFPPIERLCAPIDGTSSMRLAECLGLDIRKYQIGSSITSQNDREIHPLESKIPDEERFKDATKLSLRCRSCKMDFHFEGLIGSKDNCCPQGILCPSSACGKVLPVASITAQVEHQIRQLVATYSDAWLVCDDTSCGNRTRQLSVYGKRCLGPKGLAKGCRGVMHYEYTDKMLYNQLLYFKSLFDVEKAKTAAGTGDRDVVNALAIQNTYRFGVVSSCIGRYLEKCGRQWVGMQSIFSFTVM